MQQGISTRKSDSLLLFQNCELALILIPVKHFLWLSAAFNKYIEWCVAFSAFAFFLPRVYLLVLYHPIW